MIPPDDRPVLANRVGRYSEVLPLEALRPHFRCMWSHATTGPHAMRLAVVPDGCVDLLWRADKFVVVGPDVVAARPMLAAGKTVVGLRFQPGAASQWLGLPMSAIVGQTVPMTEFWGPEADRIGEALASASTDREQALLLQRLLLARAQGAKPPPREAASIVVLLWRDEASAGHPVAAAGDHLNMSERTLRRWSDAQFGYGPKTLHRILRFQRFRALAATSGEGGLAGLAFDAGYADQAHLSREVQDLCGMTAAQFVRQLAG